MVVERVSTAEYLGKWHVDAVHAHRHPGRVRAAAARRTSEKLYKRLVKYGRGYEVRPEEDIPGSRVLLGELLLVSFVEQCNSGGSAEDMMEQFHNKCLHEISQTGYLLSYAQPYNLPPLMTIQNLRRFGSSHSLSDLSPCSPQATGSPTSRSPSRVASPTAPLNISEVDVDASTRMTIGEFRDNEANVGQSPRSVAENDMSDAAMMAATRPTVQRQVSSIPFGAESAEVFYGPAQYSKSPQRLLETIGHTSAHLRVWDSRELESVVPRNCTVLWKSRIATLFTIAASFCGDGHVYTCTQCKQLLRVISSSFPWSLTLLMRCMKRIDHLETVYSQMFHRLVRLYSKGDALTGTYYAHVATGIAYTVDTPALVETEPKTLVHILAGWLADRRIHRFIEPYPSIKLHKILLAAIMKLGPSSTTMRVDREHLELLRGAVVSFMLGFGMHVLEDICKAGRISFDKYTTQGVRYSYRLNLRLRQLRCMVEEYVRVAAPFAQKASEARMIVAPFLGNPELYRWLLSMNFSTWSSEEQRMQCRLAIVVLYLVAVNHQHPYVRSEDIRFLRKFHCLPWASAISFCCKDPAINHMVAPLTSALVQCLGEGAVLNLVSGDTVVSMLNEVMMKVSTGEKELHGYRELKLESIVPLERTTVYTPLRILWPKIMSKVLGHTVRRMSLPPMLYYSVAHLMRIIWEHHDPQEGANAAIVHVNNEQGRFKKFYNEARKQSLEVHWSICHLNMLYSIESTLFDSAFLDSIIYNYVVERDPASSPRQKNALMLFCNETKGADMQKLFSSNYIALHQNPINVLLRMPKKAVLNSFALRAFPNMLLQLFHSLYKYVCYGLSSFNVHRKTQLELTHINALQEAAALNVILDMLPEKLTRTVEINISSFLWMLSSRATFTDDVIASSGLPPNKILLWLNLGVPEERRFEKVAERFNVAAENLLKSTAVNPNGTGENITIIPSKDGRTTCLEPYSAGDVATYHLYTVLLQVMEMPELSKTPANIAEDANAQRFAWVIDTYWRCLQKANLRNSVLEFIKSSISIVLRLHYLCPWMVNKSTDQLQTWIHTDRSCEPELQEFTK
ncbi:hypothetical protein, conserved [Babesia bigemina]|uniref:Uncharacterized protein n=1 Tax=Babesia bigemina TaxID=5866 RepID=A0A061D8V0_BABBI|nr:hypothetical protein, conserved [Babesia bigemina]CDR96973.1 hypothetical protein, conserved [Babesia bigemina]|eukprot:XP_012769159.1 hypothetical protein, conserved [Babesia bigemina]